MINAEKVKTMAIEKRKETSQSVNMQGDDCYGTSRTVCQLRRANKGRLMAATKKT